VPAYRAGVGSSDDAVSAAVTAFPKAGHDEIEDFRRSSKRELFVDIINTKYDEVTRNRIAPRVESNHCVLLTCSEGDSQRLEMEWTLPND
jgi:hypothetical protein